MTQLQYLMAENEQLQREIYKIKNSSAYNLGSRAKNIESFKENRRLVDELKRYRMNCENQNEKIKKLQEDLVKAKNDNTDLDKKIRSLEYKTNQQINAGKKEENKSILSDLKNPVRNVQNIYVNFNKEKRRTAMLLKLKEQSDIEVSNLKQKIGELEDNENNLLMRIKSLEREIKASETKMLAIDTIHAKEREEFNEKYTQMNSALQDEVVSQKYLRLENEILQENIENILVNNKLLIAAEMKKHEIFKTNCTTIFEYLGLEADAIQNLSEKLEQINLKEDDDTHVMIEEKYKTIGTKHKISKAKYEKLKEKIENSKALENPLVESDTNNLIGKNHEHNLRKAKIEKSQDVQNAQLISNISEHFEEEFKTDEMNRLILNGLFEDRQQNSVMRCSLFSHVPPYIRFSSYEKISKPFPLIMQHLLKWFVGKYTPEVIVRIIENSGFTLIKPNQKPNNWIGSWEKKSANKACLKDLDKHKKINDFPGTSNFGNKRRLWINIRSYMLKYSKGQFDIMPKSYLLPEDYDRLHGAWHKYDRWIVKPPMGSNGVGIKIVSQLTDIPRGVSLVVQRYINNPFLINGTKFDLRLYVLITSVNPLKLYLYENGLVRFASVKYSSKMTKISKKFMHLTNYNINKYSRHYTQNENDDVCQGQKWTLRSFWTYMEEKLKIDVQKLKDGLVDSVIKTIISGEAKLNDLYRSKLKNRYNAFELLGVDVLIDESLKPWILEVQRSPSLNTPSGLDLAVKAKLVQNVLNMVGYQIPIGSANIEKLAKLDANTPLFFNKTLYTHRLSDKERRKQRIFTKMRSRKYIDKILDNLLPDDIRHLIVYEDELTQIGSFQKIFPTTSSIKYHQYFDGVRYYDMLFDAWECKYNENRADGINVLEKLCRLKVHL